ncbi:MAG: putative peptidyl-prolyl cis-trans isomerase [Candidatus Saccharibacteria bacterium]|nr:putative peptidyl-prolyl cis-trans isomerase [Candidatus Saccharibacteria bacterium]
MSRKRDRATAMFFAALFIFSSSALTIAVIVQTISDNNAKKKTSTTDTSTTKQTEAKVDGNKLQGTQLADFTPLGSITELKKIDTVPGTGNEVKAGATVTVHYTGAVASTGVIFQSSKDTGKEVTFPLSGVIAGWSQGVPGMKEGGTRRLLIPANLAYGANPPAGSGIPANADLVFDISLSKIGQ